MVAPSKPDFAHQRKQFGRVAFAAIGFDHARLQLLLRKGMRGIADHAFVVGQLVVETEGVGPIKMLPFRP